MSAKILAPFALLLVACSSNPITADRKPQSSMPPVDPVLGENWSAEDAQKSSRIVEIFKTGLIERSKTDSLMRRDAHPKAHGCVKAFVELDPSALPREQQVGVFALGKVQAPAWIRFSNGDQNASKSDGDGDVRGMAMKVMGLPGENFLSKNGLEPASGNQDFLMMNSKNFFVHDVNEYLDLMNAFSSGNAASIAWFMVIHPKTLAIIQAARTMKVGSPLEIDYHSATPYLLGDRAVKYAAISCTPEASRDKSVGKSPTYLRERLVQSLSKGDSCFRFMVQIDSKRSMPVEDPRVEWSEKEMPFVQVGTIRIPRQEGVDSAEQTQLCENLSFNPWRSYPENRPLGGVNRVRLDAYTSISSFRRGTNGVTPIEPKNHDVCKTAETQSLCQPARMNH